MVCEPLGLWASGHEDGAIVLRLIQSLDLAGAPPAEEGQQVEDMQPPAQHAVMKVCICFIPHPVSGHGPRSYELHEATYLLLPSLLSRQA